MNRKASCLCLQFDLKTEDCVRSELIYSIRKKVRKVKGKEVQEKEPLSADLDVRSKAFHQNICWSAMGKCDRCKATSCSDRDWRKRGAGVPA